MKPIQKIDCAQNNTTMLQSCNAISSNLSLDLITVFFLKAPGNKLLKDKLFYCLFENKHLMTKYITRRISRGISRSRLSAPICLPKDLMSEFFQGSLMSHQLFHRLGKWKTDFITQVGCPSCTNPTSTLILLCGIQL